MVKLRYLHEITDLANTYKVHVVFKKLKHNLAQCDGHKIEIDLYKCSSRSEGIGAFFHELGHLHCHKKGIWKNYHNRNKYYMIQTGLKAERWVDRWAERELKKWYPRMKYNSVYNTKYGRDWYHKHYLAQFR